MVVMGSFFIRVLRCEAACSLRGARKVVVSMKPRLFSHWFMFSSLVVSASLQVNIYSY